jgi:hypothetical protein
MQAPVSSGLELFAGHFRYVAGVEGQRGPRLHFGQASVADRWQGLEGVVYHFFSVAVSPAQAHCCPA